MAHRGFGRPEHQVIGQRAVKGIPEAKCQKQLPSDHQKSLHIIVGQKIVLIKVRFPVGPVKSFPRRVAVILVCVEYLGAGPHDAKEHLIESVLCKQVSHVYSAQIVSCSQMSRVIDQ